MNLNIWVRLILTIASKYWRSHLQITESCSTRFLVLPTDLDLNLHMNNARYFALMDIARLDLLQRTGLLKTLRERKWYPVVADETISFGKSLDLFDKVNIITKIHGWDEKFIFLEQTFQKNNEIVAGGIVKSCILNNDGPIPTKTVLSTLKHDDTSPELSSWIKDWSNARKPLLKRY
jgi:YbgC/YbaW family acyl-CoA thioester hydrolase